jgi:cyclic-di-GMP phosphodiesterase TipF (flagellum assembly factor)
MHDKAHALRRCIIHPSSRVPTMAFLFLLPPFAGVAVAALLWAAGNYQLPGMPVLGFEWLAIAGLATAVLTLCASGMVVTRRIAEKFAGSTLDTASFERSVTLRLAQIEARPLAEPAAHTQRNPAPAPERFTETLRVAQAAFQTHPAPEAKQAAPAGENNVVQLDRTRASQEKRSRQPLRDIEKALAEGRHDAWYQPVVSLPERRTRYLTGVPYLISEGEQPVAPDQWLKAAADLGHAPGIDRFMLLDGIKLWRDLNRSQKDCGIIWRPNRATLSDKAMWGQLIEVMKANRAVGKTFICEIGLAEYARLSHAELDALFAVREAGFQIGLGECADPRVLANALKSGVISMASADVTVFAEPNGITALRSGDLAVEFIATGVADEDEAIALIDRDIRLAQGPLFAPARPLRRNGGNAIAPEGAA